MLHGATRRRGFCRDEQTYRAHFTHPIVEPLHCARLVKTRVLARQGLVGETIAPFATSPVGTLPRSRYIIFGLGSVLTIALDSAAPLILLLLQKKAMTALVESARLLGTACLSLEQRPDRFGEMRRDRSVIRLITHETKDIRHLHRR